MCRLALLLPLLLLLLVPARGKVYERCELARELRDRHRVPPEQIATWVCIAYHESRFDTSAVGTLAEGRDNGIFQISDLFWCEQGDEGGACGLRCSSLLDDDIADDYRCARRIHRAHHHQQGDGFRAWAVYQRHCSAGRAQLEAEYTHDCFTSSESASVRHYQHHPVAFPQPRPYSWWYYNTVEFGK